MVIYHGWMVELWVENDGIYTTSLTCTNTPHSRGARKQAHLHRGDGSVLDSPLNFWGATAIAPTHVNATRSEGNTQVGLTTRWPAAALREKQPRKVAPAEEIRDHRRHGERSAPSREVAFSHKSPCLSTQRGRPTPEHDARANHLASPARADVQRQ